MTGLRVAVGRIDEILVDAKLKVSNCTVTLLAFPSMVRSAALTQPIFSPDTEFLSATTYTQVAS